MRFQLSIAEDFSAGRRENPAAALSQGALPELPGLVPAPHFGILQGQEEDWSKFIPGYILETQGQLQVSDDFRPVLVVVSCDWTVLCQPWEALLLEIPHLLSLHSQTLFYTILYNFVSFYIILCWELGNGNDNRIVRIVLCMLAFLTLWPHFPIII